MVFARYEEAAPGEAVVMLSHALRSGPQEAGESAGDKVGAYTLVEKIGDGGFGTVWRVRQEEPVRREVAMKVLKPGMDTLEVINRFEQERAALALMDHPNIARVFDAGATPRGRPYFVMELVRGVPVTQYCLEHGFSLGQRLALFKAVCAGVQHAHQKGLVHRDLKPSNILVAETDGAPVPKIIDFGIAKATSADKLSVLTLVTRQEQMIGTPLYMSPEQAGASADIDTRSDVYSLGALLYELLTGQPPFDAKTLMNAGLDEMRRIIREDQPRRPSKRLAEEALGTWSFHSFSPDLDLITLRALEKDRNRRYESATALGDDIQRFLNHQPVVARAPSLAYLAQRWVRRNRIAAAAASVCLLAIVSGAGAALWQAHLARLQLADADAATQVVLGALTELQGYGKARLIDRTRLVQDLVGRIEHFSGDPLRKATMLAALSDSMPEETQAKFDQSAVDLATQALGPNDPRLWDFRLKQGRHLTTQEETRQEGIAKLRPVIAWMRAHNGPEHGQTVYGESILGRNLNFVGRTEEGLALMAHVDHVIKVKPTLFSASLRAFMRMDYGQALFDAGRHEEGLAVTRENVHIATAELRSDDFNLARSRLSHAALCYDAGLLDEAEAHVGPALHTFWEGVGVRGIGAQGVYPERALNLLLNILQKRGNTPALLAVHRDAVRTFDAKLGAAHEGTTQQVARFSRALVAAGQPAEADQLDTDWLSRIRLPDGTLPPEAESILRAQIEVLRAKPDFPRAEKALRDLLHIVARVRPQDLQRYGDQSNLADVLIKQHRGAEAVPLLEETVRVLEQRGTENERVKNTHLEQARRRLAEARKQAEMAGPGE